MALANENVKGNLAWAILTETASLSACIALTLRTAGHRSEGSGRKGDVIEISTCRWNWVGDHGLFLNGPEGRDLNARRSGIASLANHSTGAFEILQRTQSGRIHTTH